MFQRIEQHNGLVFYQSTLLIREGILHGFSTRQATYGMDWDLTQVHANPDGQISAGYLRLQQATGCQGYPLIHLRQVHGHQVIVVDQQDIPPAQDQTADATPQADGLITTQPGIALTIRVADCIPLLLAGFVNGQAKAVAAVHAGWRGVVAGVIPQAVRTLHHQAPGAKMTILAAIGPCIGPKHFEVGPEVATAFVDANLNAAIVPPIPSESFSPAATSNRPHIDLPLAAKLQLQTAGVEPHDIDVSNLCTFSQSNNFYSYRRDQGQNGRLATLIALQKM